MPRRGSAVHVTTTSRHYTGKDGQDRLYQTVLLRRSYRQDGKVRNETLANLSHLPAPAIDAIRSVLDGKALIEAGAGVQVTRSLGHGHAAAVHAVARQLGFPAILGPACPERDLAYALILSRVIRPASKLATLAWWDDITLGPDLAVAGASTDDAYAAMDWLRGRQDMIETGLLTDRAGRPVAIRVFAGSTADPTAFIEAVRTVREDFGLAKLVMVGDRGMITSARITAGKLRDPDKIGLRAGRVVNKYKVAKHLTLDIGDGTLTWARDQERIDAEAALDGIYIIRTSVPASEMDAPGAVTAYKSLAQVERDFRSIKADDLDLRPVFHRLDERVRAHVLICMLACYLSWHLRQAWAPLTFTDE